MLGEPSLRFHSLHSRRDLLYFTRLFHALPVLGLLFEARASSLKAREPAAHPLDVRDLLDVCASVNTQIAVPDVHGVLTIAGVIRTNMVAISAIGIAGKPIITALLTNLIISNAPNSHCNYPDHGHTQRGLQRRWVGSGSCSQMGHGWAACGVFGGGARAWECVDTAHDLESCGGCVLPLMPYSPIGHDCTTLPGVADVACLSGECIVQRCLPGYILSHDGTSCSIKHAHTPYSHVATPEEDDEYAQAMRYGLEHHPLQRN
ncbi:hypothetical protein H4582DRAFT_2076004 [Lactarius indigo]|nr:hypothetical protein H4582DRAFT_2076004 [Lactarius indigo]